MKRKTLFESFNPYLILIFFIIVITLSMINTLAIYLVVNLFGALALNFSISIKKTLKLTLLMIPVFSLVSIFNPLINRDFTYESLMIGVETALKLINMIVWFSAYNKIMTSEKLLYCFGKLAPSISLVVTMIMQYVPNFKRKASQIDIARKSIGKESPIKALSALTTWSFESGITTADSMKSRGYGTSKRTSYNTNKFEFRDIAVLAVTIALTVFNFLLMNTYEGVVVYGLLIFVPTILNVKEVVTWRILESKI